LNKDLKILIIGLGEIGSSNAEFISSKGLAVDGYDISKKAVDNALSRGIIRKAADDFSDYDCYLICISTHNFADMSSPDVQGIIEAAKRISKEGKSGALVGIDSTITKGTSNKVKEILNHRLHVVHVPHRYYQHEKEEHGVGQLRVIGGCEPCCLEEGARFYGGTLGIPLQKTSSIEVAELTKLVENSFRFVEIAFAEELKMFCDRIGIDFGELRAAVNTKWNVKILEARDGIGGHCLPKDSQMFLNLSKDVLTSSIVEAAKTADRNYKYHILKQGEIQQN
jgi:UDP-N-acetyl-D-mannosaminuronic acid dehydrogenase